MADIVERIDLDTSGFLNGLEKIKSEINQASNGLGTFEKNNQKAFEGAQKNVDDTGDAFEKLGGSISQSVTELGILQGGVARTIAILKAKIGAIIGVSRAFIIAAKGAGVFRAALVATGLGAIILILGGLISALSRTEKVLDFFKVVGAGAGAAFARFGDILVRVGKFVISAFNNPLESAKKILKGVGDFIVGQVVNRFKALIGILQAAGAAIGALARGDFGALKDAAKDATGQFIQLQTGITPEQWKKAGSAVKGFANEIAAAAREAAALEARLDNLQEETERFRVQEAALGAEIADAREIISDSDATTAQKKEAIIALDRAQKEIYDTKIKQQQELLDITTAQYNLNTSSFEQEKAVIEEQVKLNNLQKERKDAERLANKERKKVDREAISRQREQAAKAKEIRKAYDDITKTIREALVSSELNQLVGADRIVAEKNIAIAAINDLQKEAEKAAKAAGQGLDLSAFVKLKIAAEEAARLRLEELQNQELKDKIEFEKQKNDIVAGLISVSADELLNLEESKAALLLENERKALEKQLSEQERYYTEIGQIDNAAVQNELNLLKLNIQRVTDAEYTLREEARKRLIGEKLKALDDTQAYNERELELITESADKTLTLEQYKQRELLRIKKEAAIEQLALLEQLYGPDSVEVKNARQQIALINEEIRATLAQSKNPFDKLKEYLKDALGIDDDELNELLGAVGSAISSIGGLLSANTDIAIEENKRFLDELRNRISETENALKTEEQRALDGYQSNVEGKRQELEELKALEAERVKEDARLKKEQLKQKLISDSIQQGSDIITAITGILSGAGTYGPIAGPILAAAGIISIITMFKRYKAESKALAAQSAYKGGALSDYLGGERDGGSVAPGRSSDQPGKGRGLRVEGTNLRIGGDEFLVRASSAQKYSDILPAINAGTYKPKIVQMKSVNPIKQMRSTYETTNSKDKDLKILTDIIFQHADKIINYDRKKPIKLYSDGKLVEIHNGSIKTRKIS